MSSPRSPYEGWNIADAPSGYRRRENRHSIFRLVVVLLLALVANGVFPVTSASDPPLALSYRLPSLGAVLCAGWVSGVSIVMFQMVIGNRTPMPSVFGLDVLYALLQVALLLVLGAVGFSSLSDLGAFVLTLLATISVPVAFTGVVPGAERSVTTLVLLDIVLGTFLRSRTIFIQRLLDPNDFLVLQDRLSVSSGSINPSLLVFSLASTAAVSTLAIRELRALDIVVLGPDVATVLGVNHRRISRQVMATMTVLISIPMTPVGPIMLLGLLVAHLVCWAIGTNRHVITVPTAALAAMLVLVTGQTILVQVLDADSVLSVIIEFLGGITLVALIISSRRCS